MEVPSWELELDPGYSSDENELLTDPVLTVTSVLLSVKDVTVEIVKSLLSERDADDLTELKVLVVPSTDDSLPNVDKDVELVYCSEVPVVKGMVEYDQLPVPFMLPVVFVIQYDLDQDENGPHGVLVMVPDSVLGKS